MIIALPVTPTGPDLFAPLGLVPVGLWVVGWVVPRPVDTVARVATPLLPGVMTSLLSAVAVTLMLQVGSVVKVGCKAREHPTDCLFALLLQALR